MKKWWKTNTTAGFVAVIAFLFFLAFFSEFLMWGNEQIKNKQKKKIRDEKIKRKK